MFTSRTVPTLIATALLAVGMSSAALAQQDLRSPDTRDAAIAATQKQDLRSPDSRDAARADQIARQMRRFAAAQPPSAPAPAPVVVTDTETPWLPIALMAALSLAVVTASAAYVHRARRTPGALS
jgi:aminoglycoside phosphotransferase (APT) family kinase protein